MYKKKCTKKNAFKNKYAKIFEHLLQHNSRNVFCVFYQIVILIKYTKINVAESTVAKINRQKIVTQKFFA